MFKGDIKADHWFLEPLELRFKQWILPKIPSFIETYHLTMLTLVWSVLVVFFGYFAGREDIRWLWLVSLFLFLQYMTDLLDGALGRYRKTGLIKWGYYMDHLLDYVFLCALVICYSFLLPDSYAYFVLLALIVASTQMVHLLLSFSATNEFRVAFLGISPSEGRMMLIVMNILIIVFGPDALLPFLPWMFGVALVLVAIQIYQAHKNIWRIDMDALK